MRSDLGFEPPGQRGVRTRGGLLADPQEPKGREARRETPMRLNRYELDVAWARIRAENAEIDEPVAHSFLADAECLGELGD